MTMQILSQCKLKEKVNDDDVSQFINQNLMKGPNSKCFIACYYEKLGVVRCQQFLLLYEGSNFTNLKSILNLSLDSQIRNNTIQPDELKLMLLKQTDDVEKAMKSVNNAVDECKNIFQQNRCEFASELKNCIDKSAILFALNY